MFAIPDFLLKHTIHLCVNAPIKCAICSSVRFCSLDAGKFIQIVSITRRVAHLQPLRVDLRLVHCFQHFTNA